MYHKTKNPFGAKICMHISFQLLLYIIKVNLRKINSFVVRILVTSCENQLFRFNSKLEEKIWLKCFRLRIRFVISCSNVMECWYDGRESTEEAIGPLFRSFVALRDPELNSSHREKIFVLRSRDFLHWVHQNFSDTSLIPLTNQQPRSQGLSSYRALERARRDPGWVWSRATLTIENIGEGSSVISNLSRWAFVEFKVSRCDRHITHGVYQYLAFRLKFRIISVPTST